MKWVSWWIFTFLDHNTLRLYVRTALRSSVGQVFCFVYSNEQNTLVAAQSESERWKKSKIKIQVTPQQSCQTVTLAGEKRLWWVPPDGNPAGQSFRGLPHHLWWLGWAFWQHCCFRVINESLSNPLPVLLRIPPVCAVIHCTRLLQSADGTLSGVNGYSFITLQEKACNRALVEPHWGHRYECNLS